MSTTALTMVVVVALIAGLFAASVMALYRRRLAAASLAAAAACAAAHVVLISLAWEGAASMRWDASAAMPPISSLPTGIYDTPAWAAVAFLAIGVVLSVLQWRRRKAAEKELAKALMNFFGVNEDTKPEESEED